MSRIIFFVFVVYLSSIVNAQPNYCNCIIRNNEVNPTCAQNGGFSIAGEPFVPIKSCTKWDGRICPCDLSMRNRYPCGCVKKPTVTRTETIIREVPQYIDRVIYAPPIYINNTIIKPIFINNTVVCMQNDSIVVDMRACRSNDTNSTIVTLYESCVNATYYNSTLEIPDVITLNNTFYDSYNETEYEEEYITVEKHAAIIGLTVLAVFEALLLIAAIITIAMLTARMKKMRDELERNNSRLGSSVIPLREFSEFD